MEIRLNFTTQREGSLTAGVTKLVVREQLLKAKARNIPNLRAQTPYHRGCIANDFSYPSHPIDLSYRASMT